MDPMRAKYSSIMLFMFLAGVGICSLFMVSIEYLAGAVWSTPLRRVFEILASSLLFLPLFALPILPFMQELYLWTHKTDDILARKAAYLNQPFFLIRLALILGIWILFYKLFTGRSYKQDETRDQDLTRKNVKLSAVFIPVFGISITALSIDFLMSLEPHWFSTMFGVNFFAGSLVAALGVITITVILLNENGYLVKGIIGDHYYSLGFGMFAGCVFWTYTAFSQGMLIWYANLPEETPWFLNRWEGSWKVITIALLLVHFIGPLFGLIQRKNKRNPSRMIFMAAWVIFAHVLDLYWIVVPVFQPEGPSLRLTEFGFIAIAIGFLIVLVTQQAKKKNLVAVGDPKLQRGLAFRL
ncbi:MAG: quinol:cytochrome C oxidoreductase [Candidatus Sericytochromatia bacterium]|nr:quinol:cytochrome C oxidoreductase [Candidatus Sericytochromatia bacterium]